ncbi:hypothetical protein M758_8G105400 [Ceratodon purpureus]|uniref:Uncharacterized protein n=1 Tax=Ceratodon purpureus TaxID=3225 RepID=A0A8T0H5N8_CERPU|nr:hypothetical protein KC19_8G108900 [Ceratodon purpureus]KAG0608434.1 hypothetical protein M758_8G105400 [Ceratodon purpureus]
MYALRQPGLNATAPAAHLAPLGVTSVHLKDGLRCGNSELLKYWASSSANFLLMCTAVLQGLHDTCCKHAPWLLILLAGIYDEPLEHSSSRGVKFVSFSADPQIIEYRRYYFGNLADAYWAHV